MKTVKLCPLTPENWRQCARLKVAEEQEDYVDSNLFAIAEAGILEGYTPFAILAEEKLVGMMVLGEFSEEPCEIHHVMVDRRYQGRGFGRASMLAAIELARSRGWREVALSYWPPNPAVKLYESLGFQHTGEKWDEEPVMKLDLGSEE